jgi:hypothetical protein
MAVEPQIRHRMLGALGFLDDRHSPGGHQHNELDHGRGGVASLLASMKRTKGLGAINFSGGQYFDWASRRDDGSFQFEGGEGQDTAIVDLTLDDMTQLHAALTDALDDDTDDPGQLADEGDRFWFDWSDVEEDDDGELTYSFQFGVPGGKDEARASLSSSEMQQLHSALTLTLLVEATKAESS